MRHSSQGRKSHPSIVIHDKSRIEDQIIQNPDQCGSWNTRARLVFEESIVRYKNWLTHTRARARALMRGSPTAAVPRRFWRRRLSEGGGGVARFPSRGKQTLSIHRSGTIVGIPGSREIRRTTAERRPARSLSLSLSLSLSAGWIARRRVSVPCTVGCRMPRYRPPTHTARRACHWISSSSRLPPRRAELPRIRARVPVRACLCAQRDVAAEKYNRIIFSRPISDTAAWYRLAANARVEKSGLADWVSASPPSPSRR